jgi:hypothetical protein
MVDLNAHEAGNGGKKPRAAYSLPSLLYSEHQYKSELGDAYRRVSVGNMPQEGPLKTKNVESRIANTR